jgi:replicative DNA helicase
LDAEAAVVAAVLLDNSKIGLVPYLRPEQFYSDANGKVWETVLELAQENRPCDVVSVAARLRAHDRLQYVGGASYVAQICDQTPAVAHVEEYGRIVWERWRMRAVIGTCQKVAAEGYGDVGDSQEWADAAAQSLADLSHRPGARRIEPLRNVLGPAIKAATEAAERGERITGRSTGYERLDAKTAGLHPGDLTILAARPGMGKTSLALCVAVNVAAPTEATTDRPVKPGAAVALFSLEMPKAQISLRMACTEGRVDLGALRQGFMTTDGWRRLTEGSDFLSGLPLWIDDSAGLTLLELRSKVRRVEAECGRAGPHGPARELGLVVIDYLQLMRAAGKVQNREQEISELSRGLKQLAKDFNVPVIALSQLNRSVETRGSNKRPQLSDLRESGSIEQDSDNVLFIYRDDYYNPEKTQYRGLAELIIAKQRNGPTGKVLTRFSASCTRFDNLLAADYPEMDENDT